MIDCTEWSNASISPLRSSGAAGCMGMHSEYLPLRHADPVARRSNRSADRPDLLGVPSAALAVAGVVSVGLVASVLAARYTGAADALAGGLTDAGPGRARGRSRSCGSSTTSRPR